MDAAGEGVDVVVGHGSGSARIPIAARHPSRKDRLVLAVGTDGPAYAAQATVRDRDRLRPEQLARLGWAVHRVWSTGWLDDPNRETERLLSAFDQAVRAADEYDWAEAAAQADDVVGMPDETASRDKAAAERAAADQVGPDQESDDPDQPADESAPIERGPRPRIAAGRPIGEYTRRELSALARWVESDGRSRTEAEAITEIAQELRLPDRAPRVEDSLRHTVRVARAGAPPLWPESVPKADNQTTDVDPNNAD